LEGAENPLTSAPSTSKGVKLTDRATKPAHDDRQLELL